MLGADPQALRLEELVLLLELTQALAELDLDGADGAADDLVAGHVVRGGVDGNVLELLPHLPGQHVDALDGVAEHLDPQRLLLVGRVDLDGVTAGPERAAHQVDVVAGVLQVDQSAQDVALIMLASHGESEDAVPVLVGGTEAVDAGDRRHHDHVAAHQERRCGGVAQAVDLVVDRRVLLYVGVRSREVGLRLVVVVVGDEELDPVLGKEVTQLGGELGGQGLVGLDDEGRALGLLDHPGDGGRLAGPGDALQRLIAVAAGDAKGQGLDGGRLVAGRLEGGNDLEVGHGRSPWRIPGGCDT